MLLWDVGAAARCGRACPATPAASCCVAFAPDGRVIATGGEDGLVRLWDVPSCQEPSRWSGTSTPSPRSRSRRTAWCWPRAALTAPSSFRVAARCCGR
ncbi:MAG: WD40 repeat domain-containing protein [Gemmataceae bacterium]